MQTFFDILIIYRHLQCLYFPQLLKEEKIIFKTFVRDEVEVIHLIRSLAEKNWQNFLSELFLREVFNILYMEVSLFSSSCYYCRRSIRVKCHTVVALTICCFSYINENKISAFLYSALG